MRHFFAICIVALMSSAQAQLPSYVPTENLVAWYPFSGNANDESGYQNHGAVVGATLTMDRFGNENGAYHFDGSDHIEADHQSWLNSGLGSKTMAGWGRKTSGNDHAHFMTKIVATSEATYLRFGPNNEIEFTEAQSWVGGNGVWAVVGSVLNEWVHLVGVKDVDSGNVRIYLNGVLMGEEQIQFPELEADNEGLLFIGCEHPYVSLPSGPQYFYGDLDELGIWNRALTEEEILSLYLSESVVQGCMEPMSCNFNPEAEEDDGACDYSCCPGPGCCDVGMHWDWELGMCQITNVADTNLDGCVQLNDLLDLLSAYGNCSADESVWQCGDLLDYQGYDYETVQIGEQCWFAENLRNENYENGDAIPSGLSSSEWENTTTGSTAVYGEGGSACQTTFSGGACDPAQSLEKYGHLYNWYAVDDARGLCPNGWHVPSDEEWTVMTDFLGGESVAGVQMRTTYDWYNGGNGTNVSGFSGLPGGYRNLNGWFEVAGGYGFWWSSSPSGSLAWRRMLTDNSENVFRDVNDQRFGFSVRCVRDVE